jgi:uncharacterized protein YjcR
MRNTKIESIKDIGFAEIDSVIKAKRRNGMSDGRDDRANRKRGGQPGNTNAVGHGAPYGNLNAVKHGIYSSRLGLSVTDGIALRHCIRAAVYGTNK